jgi:hypothetical protein
MELELAVDGRSPAEPTALSRRRAATIGAMSGLVSGVLTAFAGSLIGFASLGIYGALRAGDLWTHPDRALSDAGFGLVVGGLLAVPSAVAGGLVGAGLGAWLRDRPLDRRWVAGLLLGSMLVGGLLIALELARPQTQPGFPVVSVPLGALIGGLAFLVWHWLYRLLLPGRRSDAATTQT